MKIANALRGRPLSDAHRKAVSEGHEGSIPWNKGKKTGHVPITKGKTWDEVYGKEKADELRIIISIAHSGSRNYWYGKRYEDTPMFHIPSNKGMTNEQFYGPEKAGVIQHKKSINYGRRSGLYGPTLKGHLVRSKWELRVCNWLFTHGIEYQYEPEVFDFGAFSYTPDIYIPRWNVWWEVKGYWDDKSVRRVQMFNEKYENLMVIDRENISLFEEVTA